MVLLSCIHINSLVDGSCGPLAWGLGDVLTTPHRKKNRSQYVELHMNLAQFRRLKALFILPGKISDFDNLLSEFARTPVVVKCTISDINTYRHNY